MSYCALYDILMENESRTYADCILALKKRALDTEEDCKGSHPVRRVAAGVRAENNEEGD